MRACEQCGEDFVPRKGLRRFCSRLCVGRWATANRVERYGPANNRYNGGLCCHNGRLMICCRDGTVMWFSRALMAAHLGRLLRPDEIVHHLNGDGSDDRVENLQVVTRAEHIRIHHDELMAAQGRTRKTPQPCEHCGTSFIRRKRTQRYCSRDCVLAVWAARKVAA